MTSDQATRVTEQDHARKLLDKAGLWAIVHVTFFSLAHPALVWLLARWLTVSELSAFAVAWIILALFVQIQSTLTTRLPEWRDALPPILSKADIRHQLRHHVGLAAILTVITVAAIIAVMMMLPNNSDARTTLYSLLAFALFWPTISLIILPRRIALYLGRVDLSAKLSINYFCTSVALAGLLQALNLLTAVSAFLSLATAAFLTAWPALRREWLYQEDIQPDPVDGDRHEETGFSVRRLQQLVPSLTSWAITGLPIFVLALGDADYETALFFLLLGLVAPIQAFMRVIERLHHAEPGKTALQDDLHKPAILVSIFLACAAYTCIGVYLQDLNTELFLDRFNSGLELFWIAGLAVLASGAVTLLSRGKRQRDPDYGRSGTRSHFLIRLFFIAGSVLATIYAGPSGAVTVMLLWQIWRVVRVTLFDWSAQEAVPQ